MLRQSGLVSPRHPSPQPSPARGEGANPIACCMFDWFKTKRRERALTTHALPDDEWNAALRELPFLDHYAPVALARLRELTTPASSSKS